MKKFRFIDTVSEGRQATVWLNRPAVHNALNAGLISELSDVLDQLSNDDFTDVIVIRGRGESFSSGADLNDMKVHSNGLRKRILKMP